MNKRLFQFIHTENKISYGMIFNALCSKWVPSILSVQFQIVYPLYFWTHSFLLHLKEFLLPYYEAFTNRRSVLALSAAVRRYYLCSLEQMLTMPLLMASKMCYNNI